MSHEFIRPAKRILDNPLVSDDDSILRRRPADQAFRPQCIHLVHEAERARPRQLLLEAFGRNFVPPVLLADQGMRKVDRDVELQCHRRHRLVHRVPVADLHRRSQLQILHVTGLLRDPSFSQGIDERLSAAVHHRRFRPTELDDDVVELPRQHCREDVLHGVHRDRLLPELSATLREYGVLDARGNQRRPGQIGATKNDSRAARRRQKC